MSSCSAHFMQAIHSIGCHWEVAAQPGTSLYLARAVWQFLFPNVSRTVRCLPALSHDSPTPHTCIHMLLLVLFLYCLGRIKVNPRETFETMFWKWQNFHQPGSPNDFAELYGGRITTDLFTCPVYLLYQPEIYSYDIWASIHFLSLLIIAVHLH